MAGSFNHHEGREPWLHRLPCPACGASRALVVQGKINLLFGLVWEDSIMKQVAIKTSQYLRLWCVLCPSNKFSLIINLFFFFACFHLFRFPFF